MPEYPSAQRNCGALAIHSSNCKAAIPPWRKFAQRWIRHVIKCFHQPAHTRFQQNNDQLSAAIQSSVGTFCQSRSFVLLATPDAVTKSWIRGFLQCVFTFTLTKTPIFYSQKFASRNERQRWNSRQQWKEYMCMRIGWNTQKWQTARPNT